MSKHLKEECKESRKRYRDKIDKNIRQYIADYEGTDDLTDDDDLKLINRLTKALILDIQSPLPQTYNQDDLAKQFLTTDLENRSFAYTVTATDPTDDNGPNTDPFAYIITSRYTSDEFYGIMVDTRVSKNSTARYGQYLVYRKINSDNIDTTRAGAINVQFGIGFIASIGSI